MDEEFDFAAFLEMLRKSASVKAGAVIFGEAQIAYYNTLKEEMSEEIAYNVLAITTEALIRGIAHAAGPVTDALMKYSAAKTAQDSK